MEVAIHRFEAQYRLAPPTAVAQRRLDQLSTEVLSRAFQIAVEHEGIDDAAEVCMRSLFAQVRLRLDTADEAIVSSWGAALAAEIRRVLRHGPTTNVAVYHSRRQALVDMALGVARGDRSRAWAWRQLGLWTAGQTSTEIAVSELVKALQRNPAMVVATLRAIAQLGCLNLLAARLTAVHWQELARAALFEFRGVTSVEPGESGPSPRAVRAARNVLKRSSVLNAIILEGPPQMDAARAVAALAILDVDPGLVRSDAAASVIDLIADAVCAAKVEARDGLRATDSEETRFPSQRRLTTEQAARDRDNNLIRAAEQRLRGPEDSRAGRKQFGSPSLSKETIAAELSQTETGRRVADYSSRTQRTDVSRASSAQQRSDKEAALVDLRRRAISRYGGLLFLIAVIEALDLTTQILNGEVLGSRPLAWTLHQLALVLAPVEPHDPAALAFAGLPPDIKWPFAGEPPLEQHEALELKALAGQIESHLSSVVELDELTEVSAFQFVIHRRTEIVAEPGWIEARFSLEDVATEIRRAALDLNPGFVPWLGVVIMFVYE
ncbi:MAG TPA: hypothetical protein VFX97_10150 [Pyrinomonadaceae bacterium]|nr:hypothetical protein [Pyrinomonadaceae bacterium]